LFSQYFSGAPTLTGGDERREVEYRVELGPHDRRGYVVYPPADEGSSGRDGVPVPGR
jgi:hypothetical protein